MTSGATPSAQGMTSQSGSSSTAWKVRLPILLPSSSLNLRTSQEVESVECGLAIARHHWRRGTGHNGLWSTDGRPGHYKISKNKSSPRSSSILESEHLTSSNTFNLTHRQASCLPLPLVSITRFLPRCYFFLTTLQLYPNQVTPSPKVSISEPSTPTHWFKLSPARNSTGRNPSPPRSFPMCWRRTTLNFST